MVGKRPQVPDARETADTQREYNRQSLMDAMQANQIGQQTPWGSIGYEGELGSPDRRQVLSLNPQDQARLDQQRQIQQQILGVFLNRLGGKGGGAPMQPPTPQVGGPPAPTQPPMGSPPAPTQPPMGGGGNVLARVLGGMAR